MRLRRAKGLPDHNYLFVGSGKMFGNNTNAIGEPYTIEAFRSAWKAAIGRVSNLRDDPNLTVAKRKGTTPHGARHFYGTFLKTIGCDGEIIAECMHHKSPFSHLRYTQLMPSEINEILEGKEASPSSSDFMKRSVSEAVAAQSRRYSFH
jgi:integrase